MLLSVLECTILPGLPGIPGAPLKPISPFEMRRGCAEFSENVEKQNNLRYGTFFLRGLLHFLQPLVNHPTRLGPKTRSQHRKPIVNTVLTFS